jgi:serine/threonine protein kinase/tetratricopeptide (TPR) repeat protein
VEQLQADDPERIGGHELFAVLGEGGWGKVYFARTSRGRSIALKTIRPECLEENPERIRRRFAREVEAAKAVDPRHTAEVVDFDTRAAEPWFASRYIAGVNLSEALDHCGSPLSQRTWRVLATGLTDALRSIHGAGLVHRDLKLANVLLAAEGAFVIDFGIARHLTPADGATLTGTGATLRTNSFASPEQLRDERVGAASDVFALGLVLAYTALNRHPFGPGSTLEVVSNILTGRPSLDGLPPAVEKVVRPCLEPMPGNRPGPAEIAGLLTADASPKARDWLPPGLRVKIDQRSRFAIDIDRPLRPGRGHGGATPADATASGRVFGLTSEPTPVKERSPQNARLLRERELSPDPSGQTEGETTAPPPVGAPQVSAPQVSPPQASAPRSAPPQAASPQAPADDPDAQLRASAQAGSTKAMRRLAARLKSAGDIDPALLWYRRAAQLGNPTGAREAAQLIESHFPDQLRQAVALYRMAANAGDAVAATRLVELLGPEQDRPAGAPERDAKAAARTGGKKAKADQSGGTPAGGSSPGTASAPVSTPEQAMLRKHRAAAMDGQINSLVALADWYRQRHREPDALVWYWRGAESGHPHCMFMTASLLAKDPQRDGESLKWLRAAADAGNTEAMHRLGQRMEIKQRPADALGFYRSAGDKGHVKSMVQAARLLEQMAQPVQALDWFVRAASKGNAVALEEAERVRVQLRRTSSTQTPTAGQPPKAAPPQKKTPPKAGPNSGATKTTTAKTTTAKTTPAKTGATKTGATKAGTTKTGRPSVPALRKEAAKHEKEGRLQKALDGYTQAEQLGDTASKRDAARLCLRLSDVAGSVDEHRRLRKRAVKLYRKLAQEGDQQSIRVLAELGVATEGRQQTEMQLQTQLQAQLQAAGAGSSKAMRAVARTYLRLGAEEHVQAALSWLRRAGEMNNTGAMLDGARVHEERGQHREALEWYSWARESGDGTAVPHIERLEAEHPGTALVTRLSRRLRRAWS